MIDETYANEKYYRSIFRESIVDHLIIRYQPSVYKKLSFIISWLLRKIKPQEVTIWNWVPNNSHDWSLFYEYATELRSDLAQSSTIPQTIHLFKRLHKVCLFPPEKLNDSRNPLLATNGIDALLECPAIDEVKVYALSKSPLGYELPLQSLFNKYASKIKLYIRYVNGWETLNLPKKPDSHFLQSSMIHKKQNC
ncbi:unnamed protein product [Ambrosiozyma monospora]|uniref:Unnamed protein product n=1 Tax=Ambrosiozyma monospora TaxID=43982 RepID=A0ACB5TAK9_AMBMO|nr:unnamed protein product [Ambrosiozyma monospora]